VLLPEISLLRRRDHVEVIGAALVAKAAGRGFRTIAAALGRDVYTVRAWLRAFGRAAERIRAHFTRWAYALDPMLGAIAPTGAVVCDAVAAIGEAARAAVLVVGPCPAWSVAARLSGGVLLCNATHPLPRVP
jgi:hypothetical protein